MVRPIVIALVAQAAYSASDVLARSELRAAGFTLPNLLRAWLVLFLVLRVGALAGQMFVFATVDLARTAVLFGVGSILVANVLGVLLLREVLSVRAYIGVVVAIAAFVIVGFDR